MANLSSFLQVFLLVAPLNTDWLVSITPSILIMVATSGLLAYFFFKRNDLVKEESEASKKPTAIFSLMPALKFAALLIGIKIFTKVSLIIFGHSGFVISSVIASLAGIDAIIANLADMAGKSISLEFGLITFLLVNATNLLSKSVYSFVQGDRKFAIRFLISVIIVMASGAIWLLFI